MNGKKACDHEGGFTAFDCEVTSLLHGGNNFAVIRVNDQRTRDGVPTLNTDWWNYGGLTRDVSLIETPDVFIDDYSLQLQRGPGSTLAFSAHVVGAREGTAVTVKVPELGCRRAVPSTRKDASRSRSPLRISSAGRHRIPSSTTLRSPPAATI